MWEQSRAPFRKAPHAARGFPLFGSLKREPLRARCAFESPQIINLKLLNLVGIGLLVFLHDLSIEKALGILLGKLGIKDVRHRLFYVVFEPLDIYRFLHGINNHIGPLRFSPPGLPY